MYQTNQKILINMKQDYNEFKYINKKNITEKDKLKL